MAVGSASRKKADSCGSSVPATMAATVLASIAAAGSALAMMSCWSAGAESVASTM